MYCEKCGCYNPDNAAFCSSCGAKMAVTPPPAHQVLPTYEVPVAQNSPLPTYTTPTYDTFAPAPEQQPAPVVNPGKAQGLVSMILGIVSIAMCWCNYTMWISLAAGVVALILGILGKKKSKAADCSNGQATVGIILGAIGLAISLIVICIALLIVFIALLSSM